MFGKPTGFGATFGASTAPTSGFGTPSAFGTATPSGGLFGNPSTSTTGGGLFGGAGTAGAGFGGTTGFSFGNTPSSSAGTSLFGQKTQASTTGLFGTPQSSTAFGGGGTGFGGFGTTTTSAAAGGLFGSSQPAPTGGLFGTSTTTGFGQQQAGTTVKFNPPAGQDTMVKNGVTQNINTKHQCITAMKEYEGKSLEELRVEDYVANRKGKQAGSTFGFGTTPAATTQATTGFTFGQTKPAGFGASTGFGTSTSTGGTSLFGQPAAQTGGGLFGQTKPFGTATTTQSAGFGFGGTSTGSVFGQPAQSTSLFPAAASTQSSFFNKTSTFGSTPSTGFGGFGATAQPGGLFASKAPTFGTNTATSTTGFNFGAQPGTGNSLFAKPFSTPGFGTGFNTATTSTGFGGNTLFGAKPAGTFGLATTTTAQPFNFGGGLAGAGTGLFSGTATQAKPFGNLGTTTGTTGFGNFGGTGMNFGGNTSTLGTTTAPMVNNSAAELQQTLLALTHSPYGDSPLFWNMKQSSTKTDELLKPTNPAAQKALLANQHKVSPRPVAKIKPKSLHGVLNGSKGQIFEGLEDEDFSFGNDTFMPRRSVKKLTLKKTSGGDSGTPSRATSLSGEPPNLTSLRDDEIQHRGRSSPEVVPEPGPSSHVRDGMPDTDSFLHSKGIPEQMSDTPNRNLSMDDTITLLNAKNRGQTIQPPPQQPDEITNISIISRDESNSEDILDERPLTPPPPHPAGIVLTRPCYYTLPSLEVMAELVDDSGECNVEDLTIGREGYGSIFFPGITDVTNLNFDEIVFFRRKEVVVYPDDENKPPLGEGLNKKAEVTLDCVWPRDKSIGTPVKSPEKLDALKWQEKIEDNTSKIGAKFIDYRPETGSWVFEVKHFSKYGLVDDSDEEDLSEQEKKRLKSSQQQQIAIQKQKIHQEQQEKQRQLQAKATLNGDHPRFMIGDESSDASSTVRKEVPMMDDDIQLSDISEELVPEDRLEQDDDDMEVREEQPSSHRLAKSMGVDARNMQVMKASFFMEEEAPSGLGGDLFTKKGSGRMESPLLRHPEGTGPSLFSAELKSKYMSPVKLPGLPQGEMPRDKSLFSQRLITPEPLRPLQQTFHAPVKEHLILASGMTPQDFQKKAVGTRVKRVIPPVKESYQYEKQAMFVDAGLFMGRSFRCGWGPGWTLAHCGEVIKPVTKEPERPAQSFNIFTGTKTRYSGFGASDWKVTLQKVNVADHIMAEDKAMLQYHQELMEIQLDHSKSEKQGDVPVFTPALGVDALHEYARKNKEELENLAAHPDEACVQQMGMVWDLCVALWGNMPEFKDIDIGKDSYMYHNGRREAFSRWLSAVSGKKIKNEMQENKYKEQGHLQAVLSCLTGRQIADACELAQKSGDHKLALLLAQAVSNFLPRQMLSKQLDEWNELGVDNFINETRLKIYSLLSGQLVLSSPASLVNTCEGLDWKRSLALHLWFCCQVDSPIQEAIELYDRAYRGTDQFQSYSRPPLPPYLEGELEAPDIEEGEENIQDTCYHLMTLYCKRSHPLERLLNPTTYTRSQLDYRLSWHLKQVLHSLMYTHLSEYHRAGLHMNFSSHLESLGLWEWAVFVSLHIDNPVSREDAVRTILNRHVRLSSDDANTEKEDLLQEKLMVPQQWIHHAKALRAKYEDRPSDEAWHLMKAGLWNRSHEIVLKHLAADAIIHENFEYLKQFLCELSPPNRSCTILNWNIGGKVLLKYINICQSMETFMKSKGEPDLYELDRLLPEVKSLCTEVGSLRCRNSKDRLCQSEMSKKAANLLKLTLTLQCEARGEPGPSIRTLTPYISNLPMPEDYAVEELRALTRSYMLEQTV